jgi:hypothetical protein
VCLLNFLQLSYKQVKLNETGGDENIFGAISILIESGVVYND